MIDATRSVRPEIKRSLASTAHPRHLSWFPPRFPPPLGHRRGAAAYLDSICISCLLARKQPASAASDLQVQEWSAEKQGQLSRTTAIHQRQTSLLQKNEVSKVFEDLQTRRSAGLGFEGRVVVWPWVW